VAIEAIQDPLRFDEPAVPCVLDRNRQVNTLQHPTQVDQRALHVRGRYAPDANNLRSRHFGVMNTHPPRAQIPPRRQSDFRFGVLHAYQAMESGGRPM
jgi:hypothetical protein